ADALFGLEPGDWPAPRVLTPHAGELGRLLGEPSDWVDAHRLEAVRRAVDSFRCVVLLKGADTLVGAPGEGVLAPREGSRALAAAGRAAPPAAGSGGFPGRAGPARPPPAAGASAGGRAAGLAPQRVGLVASDVVAPLPVALA